MFKSKKFSSLALATAVLLSAVTPAMANTQVTDATPITTSNNTTTQAQVGDVKTVVKDGKVVTTIKYADGTETQIVTALPSVVGSGSSSTTKVVTKDPKYNAPITFKEKAFSTETKSSLVSNDDDTRRKALQSATGITFTSEDKVWGNKSDEKGTDWLGREVTYTPVSELKAQGNYTSNANRQELLTYGIRTKDWQPYYQLAYQETPLYFTLKSDGTLEHSKIYWSWHISSEVQNYRSNLMDFHQGQLSLTKTLTDVETEHRTKMTELVDKWKAAQGPEVYVIGFNSSEDYAKYWGVNVVPSDYFDSAYNDPSVVSSGKFSEGASKRTWN